MAACVAAAPAAVSSSRSCTSFCSCSSVCLRQQRQRRPGVAVAAVQTSPAAATTDKSKPDWAGDDLLSRAVNAAINFPPLFAVLKVAARGAMKSTAEKKGVPWGATVAELQASEVYQIKKEVEDPSVQYPWYYTQPFHGYTEGNLNWLAAFEVEPATQVMALRVWKTEELTPQQAQLRLRRGILDAVRAFAAEHSLQEPAAILDVGCSVGVSARWLGEEWPQAQVTGMDLSPYFLAVAELRERQMGGGSGARQRIRFLHANIECSGLPEASFDLISIQFLFHECPAETIDSMTRECRRLLREGGMLLVADNNPRSKVIQNLPPVLFTLMKSTEPHSDSYYQHDVEGSMREAGLQGVVTQESDPRHRVVMGYAPQQQQQQQQQEQQ